MLLQQSLTKQETQTVSSDELVNKPACSWMIYLTVKLKSAGNNLSLQRRTANTLTSRVVGESRNKVYNGQFNNLTVIPLFPLSNKSG